MSLAKLNARDVAKDFGMQAKAITAILTEHTGDAVSPTKILTDRELSIIFESLTQRNQVDSIESIYSDVYHEPKQERRPPRPRRSPPGRPPPGRRASPPPRRRRTRGTPRRARRSRPRRRPPGP